MIRIVLVVILTIVGATLLTACSFGAPTQALIEQAIALQLTQTQQELGQLLYRDAPEPPRYTISRIKTNHRDSLTIQEQPAYHLQGTYDLTLNFTDHQVTQHQNAFEVYLQKTETEAWQLARPQANADGKTWDITAIAPPA